MQTRTGELTLLGSTDVGSASTRPLTVLVEVLPGAAATEVAVVATVVAMVVVKEEVSFSHPMCCSPLLTLSQATVVAAAVSIFRPLKRSDDLTK
jgi:hypothetical protein